MLNIEEKLFHGINLCNYSEYIGDLTEIKILEMILKSRMLLARKELENEVPYNFNYMNEAYCQIANEVCLSIHPNNKKIEIKENKYEDDFYDFIIDHISIIDHLLE